MAVYKLTAFPRALQVTSGPPITVRPMQPTDTAALLEFFRGIPDEERYFLKDDVASDAVIESWARHLDYDRALPLLAFDGDRVCADGVLIRHRGNARSHYAEVRIVVDPAYRERGLGTAVLKELIDIAWDAEIESVQGEFVTGMQEDALRAVKALGGIESGHITDAYRDQAGHPHDLVFLRVPLGRSWQWSRW
jgi:GNAT superfamily N-acetyltransferase